MEHIYEYCVVAFASCLGITAGMYYLIIIPQLRRESGISKLFEAGLQLRFAQHIRDYGFLAKQKNNKIMIAVYYIIITVVVISVLIFLIGIMATMIE